MGKKVLPDKFQVTDSSGHETRQEIFVNREINMHTWMLDDQVRDSSPLPAPNILGCSQRPHISIFGTYPPPSQMQGPPPLPCPPRIGKLDNPRRCCRWHAIE